MASFRISGRVPLHGTLTIAGRKNAALKLIAASLLTPAEVTIHRVPDIGDVRTMLEIIEAMGATVTVSPERTLRISSEAVSEPVIPAQLARSLRASLVLVGPLLARFGRAVFPHPGGCLIGKRTIEPHLNAFARLGAEINYHDEVYELTVAQLTGADIYLKERSVTGTENAIMAAVGAHGTTRIRNAAEERHIVNLCDLLRSMGYSIQGDGSSTVTIEGRSGFQAGSAETTVIADEIEVGTFAVAALLTGGEVTLEQVGNRLDLLPILSKLDDLNARYQYDEGAQRLQVLSSPDLHAADLQTNPWPGFPSDLQSPFTVLATQLPGTSLIHDWMYEGRLYFVSLLQQMGAQIVTCDPHRVLVTGPTPLHRSSLITPDLRAGAAFILAALAAEGTSTIEHAELIERGYDRLDVRLRSLGAQIERVSESC